MAGVKRFEDIEAWQRARELTRKIYQITSVGEFAHDFGLRDQIRRAAVSIMSNIAEGFERRGDKEFVRFVSIAKGSCGELRCQLYIALDQGYLEKGQFESISQDAVEVGRMLSGLMKYLEGPRSLQ